MSLQVKDVMVTNLVKIEVSGTVNKAAVLMNKYDIGCLIVVKKGKPIGIITERDMLKRVLLRLRDPRKTRIGRVMSKPLITSSPQTPIQDAVKLMNERRIKKLAVVVDGRLLGLVSLTDVVRTLGYFEHVISSLCDRCELRKRHENTSQSEVIPNSD